MFVSARTQEYVELGRELADALTALDLDVHEVEGSLSVDGVRLNLNLVTRAHPTPADLSQLIESLPGQFPAMVVADRISGPGREVLRRAGWGWLDRRGHLRIWTPGLRIESVIGEGRQTVRPKVSNPWTTVGLEIALAALVEPTEQVTARRVAPRIDRSVGATHELIARFTELGLVGPSTRLPLLPDLFWETAAQWPDEGWVALPVSLDELAERVGGDQLVRVDERAATLGGARIPAAGDLPSRCYLTTDGGWRRARSLADRSGDAQDRRRDAQCFIRRAPVTWLPDNDDHPPDDLHPWRVAHPIVCALRLAADPARGRETVQDWGIVPGAEP